MINGSAANDDRLMSSAVTDPAEVMAKLNSRPGGHYNEEITTSRIKYGKNEVSDRTGHAVIRRLRHAFVNTFIITLATIDVLWMVLDPDIVYFVILTSLILVSGLMTFVQETRSSKAASELANMVTTIITVRREETEIEVDSRDLVVGDIVILDTGDVVPADVRLIESNHLQVDQSALTGESGAVTKHAGIEDGSGGALGCDNLAFMGTSVIGGSAEAVVVAVGDGTIMGSMTEKLSAKRSPTSYEKGTNAIVMVLLKLMFYTVPPVFLIMTVKGYINNGCFLLGDILEALTFALVLAVGLMPEMLSTIVSTNLAKGAIDMSKKKVIVKDVTSIQNLGAMDVLCSDKTGTLTQNRITVEDCCDVYGNSSHSVEALSCLNSRNLRSATNQIDWAVDEYASEYLDEQELDGYGFVADIPFDFTRRRSTVVVRRGEDVNMMITKGAIPEILSISIGYLDADRDIQPLDSKMRNDIMGLVEWYSSKGMRVLGITHRYFPVSRTEFGPEDECDLIFAGFIVFTDPVKPSAKKAVEDLRGYGVDVKVLSGDNEYVSRHVCGKIGIEDESCLVGTQIDSMDDSELREAVEAHSIFARLDPDNKARVVSALRANGHTVGLMGDGINDVLAMKSADVSLSVDTSTDIAKETADMILLEKDLGILKEGAIEGRKVYVNSVKYVKMIGSINFGYMFSLVIATILFNFEPMGPVIILIFNLINDFACLAIPWDRVEDKYVREPRRWDPDNLKSVMVRYGPMCVVTDLMTWAFMVFAVFPNIPVEGYGNAMEAILSGDDLMTTALPVVVLFQSIWCIEQYWMQVWAIHIVRTDSLPFVQAWSSKMLVFTTVAALAIGTVLPFTGPLWEAVSGCDALISVPLYVLLWMPFIALTYFALAHLVKKNMLRTKGYFAC